MANQTLNDTGIRFSPSAFYFCAACLNTQGQERQTIPVCRDCLSLVLLGECGECSKEGGDCCFPSFPCECKCHKLDREAVKFAIIKRVFPHVTEGPRPTYTPFESWEKVHG